MYNSLFFLVLALCCICTARVCLASSAAFSNIYATENYSGVVKIDKKASFAVRYEALDSNTLIKSVRNNFKYQAIVVILTDAFFNDNNIGMSTKTNSLKDKFLRITGMPLQYVMIEDRNHVSCLSCSLAFRHLGVFFVENFNKIIDSRYFPDRLTGINLIYFDNLDKMARRHLNEIINRESLSMKTITQDFDFSAKMRPVELALEASIQSGGRTIQVFSMLPLSTTSHDSSASANEPITIVHPTSTAEIEEQSASESEHGEESYHEPENNENTANVPQNVENTENVTEHDDSTENVTQLDDSTENITQHDENTENVPQHDENTVNASQNEESAENVTQNVEKTENVTTNLATEDENLAILQSQEHLASESEGEDGFEGDNEDEGDNGDGEGDNEEIDTSASQENQEGAASESEHELENDEGNTVNVPTTTSQLASGGEGKVKSHFYVALKAPLSYTSLASNVHFRFYSFLLVVLVLSYKHIKA